MKNMCGLIIVTALLFLLTACGGGDSTPSKSVNVTLTDFQFTPDTFTVPAGVQINFTAVNNGAVEHSFVVMKSGIDVTSGFSDKDQANVFWEEAAIPAGQSVTDTFTAPSEPGTYQIVCAVPGHLEAGMIANLVVVSEG